MDKTQCMGFSVSKTYRRQGQAGLWIPKSRAEFLVSTLNTSKGSVCSCDKIIHMLDEQMAFLKRLITMNCLTTSKISIINRKVGRVFFVVISETLSVLLVVGVQYILKSYQQSELLYFSLTKTFIKLLL